MSRSSWAASEGGGFLIGAGIARIPSVHVRAALMEQRPTGLKVLAWAVLALCVFAYVQSSLAAWWLLVVAGNVLAVVVFARAWAERRPILDEPLSTKVMAFVSAELLLPVLVILTSLAAMIAGGGGWLDAAIVLAVTLACVSLL